MGFFSGLGKFVKGALPVVGGVLGGPVGAAIGGAVSGGLGGGGGQQGIGPQLLSGVDFSRMNQFRGDLQGRSAEDFAQRQALQDAFMQSFINQNQLTAPDLSGLFAGSQNPFAQPTAGPVAVPGPAVAPPTSMPGPTKFTPVQRAPAPTGTRRRASRPQSDAPDPARTRDNSRRRDNEETIRVGGRR